jgi:hypothetical protein
MGIAETLARQLENEWLDQTLTALRRDPAVMRALTAFVAAARKVGRGPLEAVLELEGPEDPTSTRGWSRDSAARVAVILTIAEADPIELAEVVDTAYREGDSREKAAVLRALPLLADAGRFLELALDAGRTNETDLFAALACDNPYPARCYPELEWNKLVMKAAFVGTPIARIVGLDRRANPELARMGMEYIDEQESARRRFPPEMWLAIGPHPPPGAVGRMLGYLSHSIIENRLWAARGLALTGDPRARSFLEERATVEPNQLVRAAIDDALSSLQS